MVSHLKFILSARIAWGLRKTQMKASKSAARKGKRDISNPVSFQILALFQYCEPSQGKSSDLKDGLECEVALISQNGSRRHATRQVRCDGMVLVSEIWEFWTQSAAIIVGDLGSLTSWVTNPELGWYLCRFRFAFAVCAHNSKQASSEGRLKSPRSYPNLSKESPPVLSLPESPAAAPPRADSLVSEVNGNQLSSLFNRVLQDPTLLYTEDESPMYDMPAN